VLLPEWKQLLPPTHTYPAHIAARQMTIFEMGFSLLVDTFTRKKGEGVECNISPDVKVDIDIRCVCCMLWYKYTAAIVIEANRKAAGPLSLIYLRELII
jgi:hypothetical protein